MSDIPHREDNYLPEYIYQENLPEEDGFARFIHKEQWYFAFYLENEMIFRSEGYANEAARDNGIESVKKHKDDNGNYRVAMLPDGKWVLELRAANNKEIARSKRFDDENSAHFWLPSAITARREAKDAAAAHIPAGHVEDDYLTCREYEGFPRSASDPVFSLFVHEGEYYFAVLDRSGKVLLRSEGYQTESARDNGIDSVNRNREKNDRYKIEKHVGFYFVMLRAGNNHEIGRSCPLKTEAEAVSLITLLMSRDLIPLPEPAGEDNYLACKKYEGHQRVKGNEDFTSFEDKGEYYFALVDQDDKVLLRSEGYVSESSRDNGIVSVTHNKGDKDRYKTEEHLGYHFVILTAPNHKEIARSCPKSEAEALALIALLTAPPAYTEPAVTAAPLAVVPEAAGGGSVKWWWWLLLLLALLLLFLFWRGCSNEGEIPPPEQLGTSAPTGPIYMSEHDCAWQPILFGFDSDSVTADARTAISRVVEELNTNSSYRALFIGFSDNTGSQDYNIELSQRRADAARAVAVSLGIDSTRISTSEQDEHNPVASNKTELGRMYNRRVVMYVFNRDNHLVCRQQELEVPEGVRE